MSTPINELELQRCVDGELPPLERRSFLERVETAPDGWKSLALAFLEDQDFDAAGTEFRESVPVTPLMLASNTPKIPRRSSAWAGQTLTLAASLAAAFWIGRQGGRPALNNPAHEGVIASQMSAPASGQRGMMTPAGVLELPIGQGENEALTIPVYDHANLAQESPEIPLWPAFEQKRSLNRPGYSLTSERNVLSIPLSTGERVLVPVEVSGVRYAVQ